MQYARCTTDGLVWEAENFAALPEADLENMRRNLVCSECGEFAWFRRASRHGRPPHFCAHHLDTCGLRVECIVIGEQREDATIQEEELNAGDSIIVHLDQEEGGQIDVNEVQRPPESGAGAGGRTFVVPGRERETAQHFTMRRILLRLVQSPTFRNSNRQVILYRNDAEVLVAGAVRDVVAGFMDITPERHAERQMLYWGPIASAGMTADGKLWLNSSDRHQGVSVAIFPDVVHEFLQTFGVNDLEDLTGAHVLVAGTCYYAATGKPIIWCGSPRYIVVRRYRDARLQADV